MFTYLHLIKLVMAGNLSSACGSEQQEVQHVRGPVPRGGPHGQTQKLWLQPGDRRHQPLPGGQWPLNLISISIYSLYRPVDASYSTMFRINPVTAMIATGARRPWLSSTRRWRCCALTRSPSRSSPTPCTTSGAALVVCLMVRALQIPIYCAMCVQTSCLHTCLIAAP